MKTTVAFKASGAMWTVSKNTGFIRHDSGHVGPATQWAKPIQEAAKKALENNCKK